MEKTSSPRKASSLQRRRSRDDALRTLDFLKVLRFSFPVPVVRLLLP